MYLVIVRHDFFSLVCPLWRTNHRLYLRSLCVFLLNICLRPHKDTCNVVKCPLCKLVRLYSKEILIKFKILLKCIVFKAQVSGLMYSGRGYPCVLFAHKLEFWGCTLRPHLLAVVHIFVYASFQLILNLPGRRERQKEIKLRIDGSYSKFSI